MKPTSLLGVYERSASLQDVGTICQLVHATYASSDPSAFTKEDLLAILPRRAFLWEKHTAILFWQPEEECVRNSFNTDVQPINDIPTNLSKVEFMDTGVTEAKSEKLIPLAVAFVIRSYPRAKSAECWLFVNSDANIGKFPHPMTAVKQELLKWAEKCAEEIFFRKEKKSSVTAKPNWLNIVCQQDKEECSSFMLAGFYPRRFFERLKRDILPLKEQPLPVELPSAAYQLHPFAMHCSETVRKLYHQLFSKENDYPYYSKSEWQKNVLGKKWFLPQFSFIAKFGEETIGFIINHCYSKHVHIHSLGVKEGWRQKGIAKALLRTALNACAAAGLLYATIDVDTENPHKMLEFYHKEGFIKVQLNIQFGKPFYANISKVK